METFDARNTLVACQNVGEGLCQQDRRAGPTVSQLLRTTPSSKWTHAMNEQAFPHPDSQPKFVADSAIDSLLELSDDPTAKAVHDETIKRTQWLAFVKNRRLELGWTQGDLAQRMGTTQSAVSAWEAGRVDPRLDTLQRWARALDCRFDFEFAQRDDFMSGLEENEEVKSFLTDLSLSPLLTTLVRNSDQEAQTLKALRDRVPEVFPDNWIKQLLMDLTREGWATGTGEGEDRVYSLQGEVANVIGVTIQANAIRAALLDMNGNLLGELVEHPLTDSEYAPVLDVVTRLVTDLCQHSKRRVLGVGIAIAGIVDSQRGIVYEAPHVTNNSGEWTQARLAEDVERRLRLETDLSLSVVVENDANAVAAWEYLLGGNNSLSVILITGVGIGSGFILDGSIIRGHHHAAGETAHLIVDPEGRQCRQGLDHRGCLETVASPEGILQTLGLPADTTDARKRSMAQANDMISRGEMDVRNVFIEAGRAVGRLYAMTIGMVDPAQSVIYADEYLANDRHATARAFRHGVQEALEDLKTVHLAFLGKPVVRWKPLMQDSRTIAAGAIAVWDFLRHPAYYVRSQDSGRAAHQAVDTGA